MSIKAEKIFKQDGSYVVEYRGLSNDNKPVDAQSGDVFTELDTGYTYQYDGQGSWNLIATGTGSGGEISESNTFVITFSYDGESIDDSENITCDRTPEEVLQAINDGKTMIGKWITGVEEDYTSWAHSLGHYVDNDTGGYIYFYNINYANEGVLDIVNVNYNGLNEDGTPSIAALSFSITAGASYSFYGGIKNEYGVVSLDLGDGLELNNQSVVPKLGDGLKIDGNGNITINASNDLIVNSSGVTINKYLFILRPKPESDQYDLFNPISVSEFKNNADALVKIVAQTITGNEIIPFLQPKFTNDDVILDGYSISGKHFFLSIKDKTAYYTTD